MKTVYLLSGLGADKRVFDFVDLSGYNTVHIYWVDPAGCVSIEAYAQKLIDQITTSNPILVGVSFGGMVAVELSKLIATEKIILISSAVTIQDIPLRYKVLGALRLNKLVPPTALTQPNSLLFWLFGAQSVHDKNLLRTILRDTDVNFLTWALDKIMHWKNTIVPQNAICIHGTHDKMLPMQNPHYTINKGGHLMIVNRAKEVSAFVQKALIS